MLLPILAAVVAAAMAIGYRPVVVLTGSMGATMPPGALVIAGPTGAVERGDVLVMRAPGRAAVTHRVVEVDLDRDGRAVAVTRGDANPVADATPYLLGERELTARWVVPHAGRVLATLQTRAAGTAVLAVIVVAAVVWGLRRIWRIGPEAAPAVGTAPSPAPSTPPANRARRLAVLPVVALGAAVTLLGAALALFTDAAPVGGNTFTTRACYDARLEQVQSGSLTAAADGATTVTIAAVDTARSFLLFSAASASADADESRLMGRLASPTTIEFTRATDGAPPSPISVEWSVVEYECGVSVQRGVATGSGTGQLDVPIQPVDRAATFVTASSRPIAGGAPIGPGDLATVDVVNGDTVRLTSGGTIGASTEHAWQVVTFDNGSDLVTQVVTTTLANGTGSALVPIPSPVDPASTFVLASVASPNGGATVGDRLVRVRLVDATTIEVSRQVPTGPVDVSVQVVELRDGSTVRHGVVDLAVGQASATAPIPAVATSRSTAVGTVQLPTGQSGGSTSAAAGAVSGEASARIRLLGSSTVGIERDTTVAAASFGWQVVTWGGPAWADLSSPFRRRIDVTAGSVVTPNGYTTSLTLDHAAMVAEDLSRADGSDLRIWRHDGTAWAELDRVLDQDSSWNTALTELWFRTREPIAAGSSVSYWLYFGNDAPAPALDDPANVWLVSEGFDDGTTGVFEDRTGSSGWYRALPWTRRILLTIAPANVSAPLTDEVVLVRIVDAGLTAHAQPDGSDLRFTAGDGLTPLSHDIEAFDHATGSLAAWVRVPSLSSTVTTELYLVYGAADAPAQADARSTWADEVAVWPLAADLAGPAPALDDLGPGQHDGVALGDVAPASGPAGPGVALDGAGDRLESAPFEAPRTALSVGVLFRADTLGSDPVLVAHGDPDVDGTLEIGIASGPTPALRARVRLDGSVVDVTGGSVAAGTWHHAAVTWDGSQIVLWLDGVAVSSAAATGDPPATGPTSFFIGAAASGANAFDGQIGDARLDDSAWSPARVAFRATNLLGPAATVAAGAPGVGSWFDQGDWAERRPVTIDAARVAGPLTGFPVLVKVTLPDLVGGTQPDGDDIVVTAADGVSRLDHHVEAWNPATGELAVWVRVPVLSDAVDTTLYLYSGNGTAVDQQDPAGMWGPEAELVVLG